MHPRFNLLWLVLLVVVVTFSALYVWNIISGTRVDPDAGNYFTAEQITRGQQYSQAIRTAYISGFIVQGVFLLWFLFGGKAVHVSRWAQHTAGGYWGGIVLFFIFLWLVLRLIDLPFSLYGSYYLQHQWGFSNQSMISWWTDYVKGAGLDLGLSLAGVILLFMAVNRWTGTWWIAGAAFMSLWLVVQTLLWPVLISPLFNRFEPASDPGVVAMVDKLAQKADLTVGQVLVMDASSRTTRANAYFAGLGQTRRIVLYDTLLTDYPQDQVEAVIAHEMAHWVKGHIHKGIVLGAMGNFLLWGLLFLFVRSTFPAFLRYPPHTWAMVLLVFFLLSFASNPAVNYFSRYMEREADRISVYLTGNPGAAIRLEVNLAAKNASDISPPPFIRWFSYTHPPVLERIDIIQKSGGISDLTIK